jgi:cytochrome c biogenesis protein CcmG/thiol:disulfide interchange protein DsbE
MTAGAQPTKRRVSPLAVLPVVIFAGLGAAFFWGLFNNDDRLPSTLIGKPVPDFDLPPIEGRRDGLATADLAG